VRTLSLTSVKQEPITELVAGPRPGRVYSQIRRPGMGDCAPSGRLRLDALACWLQDIAYADVEDAGVAEMAVWVVRRARIRVERFPRFGESFKLSTFCAGLGRMWAERGTTLTRVGGADDDAAVDAVFLWVHLDPVKRVPFALTAHELAKYREAAGGRRVSARLRHPAPTEPQRTFSWTFRATECDLAGHVNNAAFWHPIEEELLMIGDPETLDVEIEYRTPAQPGEKTVICNGHWRWIIGDQGETLASIVMA
jgi:acyl-ACP thioesterase